MCFLRHILFVAAICLSMAGLTAAERPRLAVLTDIGGDLRESVSRWRPDFQRDFAKRMAWCVTEAK